MPDHIPMKMSFIFVLILLAAQAFADQKPKWTDPQIVARQTQIKAIHMTELRALIDLKRFECGLDFFKWEDSFLAPRLSTIKRAHLVQLREAASELSLKEQELRSVTLAQAPRFKEPVISAKKTLIRAEHINELRDLVEKINCLKINK